MFLRQFPKPIPGEAAGSGYGKIALKYLSADNERYKNNPGQKRN
jgi:hypothetical protein